MIPENIQLKVDQSYRTTNGFMCDCVEWANPEYVGRFVHLDTLLAHLGADAHGKIEVMHESWNYAKDDVDQSYEYLTLEEWMEYNDIDIELALIINKAECRIQAQPLANGFTALNPLFLVNVN